MTVDLAAVHAGEILDSRARPALAVTAACSDRTTARAGVSSGASTGSREAVELCDGDPARYRGRGVREAVSHVKGEISERLVTGSTASLEGPGLEALAHVDRALIDPRRHTQQVSAGSQRD